MIDGAMDWSDPNKVADLASAAFERAGEAVSRMDREGHAAAKAEHDALSALFWRLTNGISVQ